MLNGKLLRLFNQTITWETVGNTGYGAGFSNPTQVENVYIEEDISLVRRTDNETKADALVMTKEGIAFKVGDRITTNDRKYIIMQLTHYNQVIPHLELLLKEVNNG